MTLARRRMFNILFSLIVPPALLTTFVVVIQELQLKDLGGLELWAPVVVLIPGFLFLLREFRIYALAIGIVYFPALYWLAIWASFYAAVMLYGLN